MNGYELGWWQEPRILLARHEGVLTLDGLRRSSLEGLNMVEAARDVVHGLIDVSRVTDIAFRLPELSTVHEVFTTLAHPRLGWTVIIDTQDRSLFRVLAQSYYRDFRVRMHWAKSYAEARAFLVTRDLSLVQGEDTAAYP